MNFKRKAAKSQVMRITKTKTKKIEKSNDMEKTFVVKEFMLCLKSIECENEKEPPKEEALISRITSSCIVMPIGKHKSWL